jgi:multimeric flavodoxin WrbA
MWNRQRQAAQAAEILREAGEEAEVIRRADPAVAETVPVTRQA